MTSRQPQTIGDAARALELSEPNVRRHDDALTPQRASNGSRLYDPDRLRAFKVARSISRRRR
jgi:hypothetical protein